MKPIPSLLVGLLALFPTSPSTTAREIVPLDSNWRFFRGALPNAKQTNSDDSSWLSVTLPHDWSILGPFDPKAPTGGAGGWLPSGVAYYRRHLAIPNHSPGQRVWIEFDGIMANSTVWLNQTELGSRPNGYSSFRYDISDLARPGETSVITVKADTSAQPASRWYTGAGIYRHARMVLTDPLHIAPWGVFASTDPTSNESSATLHLRTAVSNCRPSAARTVVRNRLQNAAGETIAEVESQLESQAGSTVTVSQTLAVKNPSLWHTDAPTRYTLVSQIVEQDHVTDEVRTHIGIRTAEFRAATGFHLNGKPVKLKGVCVHHDGGAVGAAVPIGVWKRRLETLKSLGVNAIRTAHNPPAPEFLDLCDQTGFLVMDEFFDCWTKGKNPHDYHQFFKSWSHTDLRDGILRDRNHPSVVLYSVGNEIHDTPEPKLALPILRGLVQVCHENDPSRQVTQALFRPNQSGDYHNGLADLLDVIGTNYRDQELLQAWKDRPNRKIIGTEQSHERSTWLACRDNPQHSGQFLWVGIDYLGESRSWPLTVFNAGLIDRAGFIQPRGWERQSWWSESPMVKILRRVAATAKTPADPGYETSEWKRDQVLFDDWTPSDTSPHQETVEVYSNAEEVGLFLNGKSLGWQKTRKDAAPLSWNIPFETGSLAAVARTNGQDVARDELKTAGPPAGILLKTSPPAIHTSWDDVANVEVSIVDASGTRVPAANHSLTFEISANAEWVAADNGAPYSTEPFHEQRHSAFQGRCLAILRARNQGTLQLTAHADALPAATISITSTAAPTR